MENETITHTATWKGKKVAVHYPVGWANAVVKLKSLCGPGDNGEPVITIMLPNED